MRSLVQATRKIISWIWAIFILQNVFTIVVSVVAAKVYGTTNLDDLRASSETGLDFQTGTKMEISGAKIRLVKHVMYDDDDGCGAGLPGAGASSFP